ncbi:unnamed protein product [Lota lota]
MDLLFLFHYLDGDLIASASRTEHLALLGPSLLAWTGMSELNVGEPRFIAPRFLHFAYLDNRLSFNEGVVVVVGFAACPRRGLLVPEHRHGILRERNTFRWLPATHRDREGVGVEGIPEAVFSSPP